MKKIVWALSGLLALTACHTSKQAGSDKVNEMNTQESEGIIYKDLRVGTASPAVFVYKMRGDYSNLVPVVMNEEKTAIVSYPDPSDVYYKGELALPTQLADGYWLDNRGISKNAVFTSYTYEEYSKLEVAPSTEELMKHIVDLNPIVEWHQCGYRADYTDIVTELNTKIKEGKLSE